MAWQTIHAKDRDGYNGIQEQLHCAVPFYPLSGRALCSLPTTCIEALLLLRTIHCICLNSQVG